MHWCFSLLICGSGMSCAVRFHVTSRCHPNKILWRHVMTSYPQIESRWCWQLYRYNAVTLKGKWISLSYMTVGDKCLMWWRQQMEIFSALLALCAGNAPVTSEFPAIRPVVRSFGVFCDLRLNKRLSKQSWGWWFETASGSLWRHCNELTTKTNLMESRRTLW